MKRLLPLLAIFILVILFFHPLFSLFFSQDDFFHFRISQTDGTLSGFINLFLFRPFAERGGIYFYRPVFREFFYHLYYGLFGLDQLPYRITQFVIHFVNIGLTYLLVEKTSKNRFIALIAAGVFGLSSANIGVLSFLGSGIQVSGMTMFFLASIIFYVLFLEKGEAKYKLFSLFFFLLALASHELALALPFVLVGLTVLKGGKIEELLPYFVFSAILVFLEIRIIGLPTGEKQYSLAFSPIKLFNAYEWYFVWGIGIPEMLLDFVGPGVHLNPNLMKYWGDYFRVIFPIFFLIIFLMLLSLKKVIKERTFWFFIFWFFVGITPVVVLPLHKASYYLTSNLPAIGGILGYVFYHLYSRRKALGVTFLVSLLILFSVSADLSLKTYWAVSRGKIAQKLLGDIQSKFPVLPAGASVYFTNDPAYPFISKDWGGSSKQASVVLSGGNALQVVYKDPNIKVYYEDLEKPETDKNLFTLTAKIPF